MLIVDLGVAGGGASRRVLGESDDRNAHNVVGGLVLGVGGVTGRGVIGRIGFGVAGEVGVGAATPGAGGAAVPVASRSEIWKIFTAPSAGRFAFNDAIASGRACNANSRRAAAAWCRSCVPSSPVMQFFLASRLASRVGSPALNGCANAVSNRICLAARKDRAFSLATMASTNADPVIESGAAGARPSDPSPSQIVESLALLHRWRNGARVWLRPARLGAAGWAPM
jgi:hypothetical protein